MSKHLMITVRTGLEAKIVRSIGCEIIAKYTTSLLIRCSEEQYQKLKQTQLRSKELV